MKIFLLLLTLCLPARAQLLLQWGTNWPSVVILHSTNLVEWEAVDVVTNGRCWQTDIVDGAHFFAINHQDELTAMINNLGMSICQTNFVAPPSSPPPTPSANVAGPGVYIYGVVPDYPTHVAVSWDMQMADAPGGPWVDTGSTTTFNDGQQGQFGDDPNFNKYFRVRYHTATAVSDWSTDIVFRPS